MHALDERNQAVRLQNEALDRILQGEERIDELLQQIQEVPNMADPQDNAVDDELNVRGLEALIRPTKFTGYTSDDTQDFLDKFDGWAELKNYDNARRLRLFPRLLESVAKNWFEDLEEDVQDNWDQLRAAFEGKFNAPDAKMSRYRQLRQRRQKKDESVEEYIKSMQKLGSSLGKAEQDLIYSIIEGLSDPIKDQLALHDITSFGQLDRLAQAAEDRVNRGKGSVNEASKAGPEAAVVKQLLATEKANRETLVTLLTEIASTINDVKRAQKNLTHEVNVVADNQTVLSRRQQRNNNGFQPNNRMPPMQPNWAPRTATGRPMMRGPCFYCQKAGHRIADCQKRKADEMRGSSQRPGLNNRGPA